jgi:hypothetical protein
MTRHLLVNVDAGLIPAFAIRLTPFQASIVDRQALINLLRTKDRLRR